MSYNRHDVKVASVCDHIEDGDDCDCYPVFDAKSDSEKAVRDVAYLPHSCDHWVIGGKDEVRQLIADLQDIMDDLK